MKIRIIEKKKCGDELTRVYVQRKSFIGLWYYILGEYSHQYEAQKHIDWYVRTRESYTRVIATGEY